MQPGYGWPDHCAYHDGNKHDENDPVEAIEKPEAKDERNEHESCPHDTAKGPMVRLRNRMNCHRYRTAPESAGFDWAGILPESSICPPSSAQRRMSSIRLLVCSDSGFSRS